jgi:AraC family transcriptional regulator of adaptative response/methylated-DNA-[protein]-cysteine methyltransferase
MTDYERIEQALRWIDRHWVEQPSVDAMAAAAGLSSSHFHRLFKRFAGITPKRMIEFLTARHARQRLMDSASVLEAALDSGLSGPGRLHDLMVSVDALTPGQIRRAGEGSELIWGVHDGPFGPCLIVESERGVCALDFVANGDPAHARQQIVQRWPAARLRTDPVRTRTTLDRVQSSLAEPDRRPALDIPGTNFQLRVWDALLRIPPGRLSSYGEIAEHIGAKEATRAVGTAIGRNPVPLLIPCHRVLRQSGDFGQYSGGRFRKRAILLWEQGFVNRNGSEHPK